MKRKLYLTLILAIIFVTSIASMCFADGYPDIIGTEYENPVDILAELSIVTGFPDGEFKPDNEMTRAEFAKLLIMANNMDVSAVVIEEDFLGVPSTHWAAQYIKIAVENGWMHAYENGQFLPERSITYAEVFNSVYSVLGYDTDNLPQDIEASINKGLVEPIVGSSAAGRGNIAILIFNMLTTFPEDDFDELLTIRFPNYSYYDSAYITAINVNSYDDVTVEFFPYGNGDSLGVLSQPFTSKAQGIDLLKVFPKMYASFLLEEINHEFYIVKVLSNYKIVSGFVEDKVNKTITINGHEYTQSGGIVPELTVDDYVSIQVSGDRLIAGIDDCSSLKIWPTEATFGKNMSVIGSDIDDESLVIVDGEWGTIDDVPVGSVYTEVPFDTGSAWFVSSDKENTVFELLYDENVDFNSESKTITYLTLDGEDYRISPSFSAYELENNSREISLDKLKVRPRDNEYTDNEVEVFYNYLGVPTRLHFGVIEHDNMGYYVLVSNGAYSEGNVSGKIYHLTLVGKDGAEVEYSTVAGFSMPESLSTSYDYYGHFAENGPMYMWVDFNENDEIEELVILEHGVTSGDPANYTCKYNISAIVDDSSITDKKLLTKDGEFTVQKSCYIYDVIPEKDGQGRITSLNVEVINDRSEYEDVSLPGGTLVAYDTENDNNIRYLFLSTEVQSNLQWGKVTAINTVKETVQIDTTEATKLGDKTGNINEDAAKGDLVGYVLNNDETKASIMQIYDLYDLDDAMIIDGNMMAEMEAEDLDDYLPLVGGGAFTLDSDETEFKDHKNYNVWVVTLSGRVGEYLEVNGVRKAEEKGHAGVAYEAEAWDRIDVREDEQSILVFKHSAFGEDVTTEGGKLIRRSVYYTAPFFAAITSNGAIPSGTSGGPSYNMSLVGQDGIEKDYSTVFGISMPEILASNGGYYSSFEEDGPIFVWVKLDNNYDIETIVVLEDGVESGNPVSYTSKYNITCIEDGATITDSFLETKDGTFQVSKSCYIYDVIPEKDGQGRITSLNVEVVNDRSEYEDVSLPGGTLVAYDSENANRIKYIFLSTEVQSNLQWGKVTAINTVKETVQIDTTEATKLGDKTGNINEDAAKGDLVGYVLNNDETKASIMRIYDLCDLDDALIIDGNMIADMEQEDLEDYLPLVGGGAFTLDSDETEFKDHKNYNVWVVTLSGRVGEYLEVNGVRKAEEKGHAGVAYEAEAWDRIDVREDEQSILVFKHSAFGEDVMTSNGKLVRVSKGDLDESKDITIVDVRLLLQNYINAGSNPTWTSTELAIMDMDENGIVDIIDVRLLLQTYINSSSEPIADPDS